MRPGTMPARWVKARSARAPMAHESGEYPDGAPETCQGCDRNRLVVSYVLGTDAE